MALIPVPTPCQFDEFIIRRAAIEWLDVKLLLFPSKHHVHISSQTPSNSIIDMECDVDDNNE